jgi:hypothetical protein
VLCKHSKCFAPQRAAGSAAEIDVCNPYTSTNKIHSFASPEQALQFITTTENKNDDSWVKAIDIGYYDSKLAAQELVNYYVQQHQLNVVSVLPGTMFGAYDYLDWIRSVHYHPLFARDSGGVENRISINTCAWTWPKEWCNPLNIFKEANILFYRGKPEDNRSLKDMLHIIAEELQTFFPDKKFVTPKIELPYTVVYASSMAV